MRLALAITLALLVAGCTLGPRRDERPYYAQVLGDDEFTDLVVEIDHAPGREPSQLAREHLLEELRNVTAKTRISIRIDASLKDEPSHRWTSEQLVALEASVRSTEHAAPVAVLHVLYPAGEYTKDGVAGVTVSGTQIGPVTVFLDTLQKLQSPAGPLPLPAQARDEVERATLLHEAGHAMGLVNNGLPMVAPHEDRENPGHSTNRQSVMWWQVETLGGIRNALLHDGSVPIYFDADDRADMRAVGGR
ncbi:MAG TPA: hypothetical protein VM370_04710 [Candidatus Thermoplasmatota archaeon]|nr:hypothetical protein [Candidatus Thermoplasmatota archaeon]